MGNTALDLANQILSSNTGKGAALGALMSALLGSYKGPGGVNVGVDMSKVGNIAPRTTQIPTPRYATYADYGARDVQAPTITPELARALGLSTGMNIPSSAQYTARPQMVAQATPQTITSAGTGAGKTIQTTLTPRNETAINPVLGGLLGASLGYLMPETQAYTSSGATNTAKDALNTVLNKVGSYITGSGGTTTPFNDTGGANVISANPDISGVISGGTNTDIPTIKDGGMVSPLMAANGGEVQSPSYYTFGQVIDPKDILNQMAQGGETKHGGLHVPTVDGRHDYRAGARVTGPGDGQSDDIPAMLADGEYVFDADTVAQLGNGSTKAGSDLLDKFREEIRGHKRSAPLNKIPPQSKSPLAYLAAAQKKLGAKNG